MLWSMRVSKQQKNLTREAEGGKPLVHVTGLTVSSKHQIGDNAA